MKNDIEVEQKTVERLTAHWRLMPPLYRAFMTELGRTQVSDSGFTAALVLMHVLDCTSHKAFSECAAAQESGLPQLALTRAVAELVELGAYDVWKTTRRGRKMTLYRMGQVIASRSGVVTAIRAGPES